MASTHRRHLLHQVACREREMDSDVIARIALDEITELDNKLSNQLDKSIPVNERIHQKGRD